MQWPFESKKWDLFEPMQGCLCYKIPAHHDTSHLKYNEKRHQTKFQCNNLGLTLHCLGNYDTLCWWFNINGRSKRNKKKLWHNILFVSKYLIFWDAQSILPPCSSHHTSSCLWKTTCPTLYRTSWGLLRLETVYSVHSTLYTVQFTVYTLHCTPYSLHCTLYNVHKTLYTVWCTLYTVTCKILTVNSLL